MGQLIDGRWETTWYDTKSTGGHFVRKPSRFRNWITQDGRPGPTAPGAAPAVGGYAAAAGRYHLYVSWACPWAHRAIIYRKIKGLEDIISLSVVNAFMGENGWTFEEGDGVVPDSIQGARFLHQVYTGAMSDYSGRVTVPVLWDKETSTIVSNESSEIIRMFNSAFDEITGNSRDYYPEAQRSKIDELNDYIYPCINNGVYRAGFATSQSAYEQAVNEVFGALDKLEQRLAGQRYLCGLEITEADWRLFTTLVRFDPVYVGHFKCNKRRIFDYPNLWGYVCDLYQQPGIAETVKIDYIKEHYYRSHETINPTRIVPVGPVIDYTIPHGRGE